MLQYLLKKCNIECEEVGCLTNYEDVEQGKKHTNHSRLKVYLKRGAYLSDLTWDSSNEHRNNYSYQHFLLSKSELNPLESMQGNDWDLSTTPITAEEKRKLQSKSQERLKTRTKGKPDIIKSAVEATKEMTRTGVMNSQEQIINNLSRERDEMVEDKWEFQ